MIAKYAGRCNAGDKCLKGGKVHPGESITWSKRQRGIVYHVDCFTHKGGMPSEVDNQFTTQAPPEVDTPEVDTPAPVPNDLAATIAAAIQDYMPAAVAQLDEKRVLELIRANAAPVTRIEVTNQLTAEVKDLGVQHITLPLLVKTCNARLADGTHPNIWLVGPAGAGKTTAASAVAKAFGLKFTYNGAMDNQYSLLGYIDANGKTIRTSFREAYENGGVHLLDEVDGYSPNASLALNAALANGHCAFPDAVIARHADFICIAAANTWGLGGTNDYVGRLKMDAAFLDRFVQINWDIDEVLETNTAGNIAWTKHVQTIRRRVREKGIKVVISPRASYYGACLLAAGIDKATVEAMTLQKAMTADQWASVNTKGQGA